MKKTIQLEWISIGLSIRRREEIGIFLPFLLVIPRTFRPTTQLPVN
jgi:hypothetical protein